MPNVIFTKYSNDRDKKFNIVTEIIQDESGKKWGVKRPFTKVAWEHVESITSNSQSLRRNYQNTSVEVAETSKYENGVAIAWVEGESFSQYLDRLLKQGNVEKWQQIIEEYFANVFVNKKKNSTLSADFAQIFGTFELEEEIDTVENIDVDILFSNVIYREKKWYIYDCEWFMPFAVPVKYLIYRCLMYYINTQSRSGMLQEHIYNKFKITESDCQTFAKMEENFQKYISGNNEPMWKLYHEIHGAVIDVRSIYESQHRQLMAQVFYDFGQGFSENNSEIISARECSGNHYQVLLRIPDGISAVRFDPAAGACVFHMVQIEDEKGNAISYVTNGQKIAESIYLYLHNDPQILINTEIMPAEIRIVYELNFINSRDNSAIIQMESFVNEVVQDKIFLTRQIAEKETDYLRRIKEKEADFSRRLQETETNYLHKMQEQEMDFMQQIAEKDGTIVEQMAEIDGLKHENKLLQEAYHQKDMVLDQILHSKRWRIVNIFHR